MDLERADREVWAAAERRAAVLVKLPERPSAAEVRTACVALGVSRATLFRWLKRYRETGRTSALLPRRPGPPQGMAPLTSEVLAVVERHFQDFYATRRRPTRTRL
jgi:putative transposase